LFPGHCDSIGDVDVFGFVFETGHPGRILQGTKSRDLTSCRDLGNNFVDCFGSNVFSYYSISELAIICLAISCKLILLGHFIS